MAYNVKEEYDRVKISKEEADRIMKKAYNKKRDMLITIGIIAGLIIIGLIFIFYTLRNHAANSLYDRVYGYKAPAFETYYPENEYGVFVVDGKEIKYDFMRSSFEFFEDNTMVWTKSFDIDLSGGEKITEEYVSTHSFEIRSDVFVGEPYIVLDDSIKLEVLCANRLGQPIQNIKYAGNLE